MKGKTMTHRTTSKPSVYCTFTFTPKDKPPFEVDCKDLNQVQLLKQALANHPDWKHRDYTYQYRCF